MRCVGAALVVGAVLTARPPDRLTAQAPRYDAAQFSCAIFDVRVRTNVTTELQGHRRIEELRRDGRLTIQGTPGDSGIAIVAWWDTLSLWRRADGVTLAPDAEGLLGGRYRGSLMPDGRFIRLAAPWVPDDVAEVSDLTVALDDLLPVFSAGTFRRLADSGGRKRFRVTTSKDVDAPATTARPFAVHESESSDGVVTWGREGVLSWIRQIIVETRVAEAPGRAFRSELVQKIELRRVGSCAGG